MNTYQAAVLAASIWIGTLVYYHPWVGVGSGCLCLVVIVLSWHRSWQPVPILAAIGLVAGFGVMAITMWTSNPSPLRDLSQHGTPLVLQVELRDDPTQYGAPAVIMQANDYPELIGEVVWVQATLDGYAGTRLTIEGGMSPPSGGFGQYLNRRGIQATIRGPTRYIGGPTSWWDRSTAGIHERLAKVTKPLHRAHAGLLKGLAIGDDRLLPNDDRAAMRTSGLSHLTAVSGSNVAMISGAILAFVWLLALGRQIGRLLTLFGIWWFVWLVRADPSVVRAAVMASLILSAGVLGRPAHVPQSLAMTVAGALLVDPRIGQQAGFALSVGATVGVLAGVAVMKRLIADEIPSIVSMVGQGLGASLGANLVTTPVLLVYGLALQPASPWANVIAAPVATLAQWGAVGTTVLATINDDVATWLAQATSYPIRVVLGIAHWFADPNRADFFILVNTIAAFSVGVLILNRLLTRWIALQLASGAYRGPIISRGQFVLNTVAILIAVRWFSGLVLTHRLPSQAQFIVLDVGQGDALLVGDPTSGWIMIDTGPDGEIIRQHLRRLQIAELNAVIITHAHTDHTGGLDAVLRSTRCTQVMASPAHVEAEAPRTIDIRAIVAAHQVPLTEIAKGDRIIVGHVTVEVLHPSRTDQGLEPNDASVVLRITGPSGVRVLATGDAEAQAQWAMDTSSSSCDVLKVPHHGGDTNAPGFLEHCGASLAIISCGKDNPYGHPHHAVLNQLQAMRVHRTDRDGTCTVAL
ncbi:ComEC/Rec2 family competence protein [Stomatohabitans albus]|uniref:ComEC/Rec2 family competence protein n=1 Tax=Stomatohabitans albus TaxID=3110766 RepID=UPI00300D7282